MRKLIALILALMLACALLPATAEVAADSVLGEWFVTEMTQGDMTIDPATMGMEISLMLNEDGTMVMTMAGEGVEGTWEMADGKLLLTAGEGEEASTVEITIGEDGTLKGEDGGATLVFSREKNEGVTIPQPVAAESEDAFIGTWNLKMISMDGAVLPLDMFASMGMDIGGTLTIEPGKAGILVNVMIEMPEITGTTAFKDGQLEVSVEELETPYVIQATDTGALYFEFSAPESTEVIPMYFEKAVEEAE